MIREPNASKEFGIEHDELLPLLFINLKILTFSKKNHGVNYHWWDFWIIEGQVFHWI